jgi:hypothetical protein
MLEEDKKVETNQEYTYAILQETSGEECESWLYFIRYQGNEDALKHLQAQLQSVDWYILDDLSTFDLEMDHLVSETTAKDMIRVDLNHYSPHRKFDGVLKTVDLGLKAHYRNEKKMGKVFDVLGYGQIEDYIDNEEIDPNKVADDGDSSEEDDTTSSEEDDTTSSEEDDDTTSSEEEDDDTTSSEEEKVTKKKGKLPKILEKKTHEIPRVAKAKQARANKNKAKKPNK